MAYIANHMIRHNGILYQKGNELLLEYNEAVELLKHHAISKIGNAPKDSLKIDEESASNDT